MFEWKACVFRWRIWRKNLIGMLIESLEIWKKSLRNFEVLYFRIKFLLWFGIFEFDFYFCDFYKLRFLFFLFIFFFHFFKFFFPWFLLFDVLVCVFFSSQLLLNWTESFLSWYSDFNWSCLLIYVLFSFSYLLFNNWTELVVSYFSWPLL